MPSRTGSVVSTATVVCRSVGKRSLRLSSSFLTASPTARELEPGAWKMAMTQAGCWLKRLICL